MNSAKGWAISSRNPSRRNSLFPLLWHQITWRMACSSPFEEPPLLTPSDYSHPLPSPSLHPLHAPGSLLLSPPLYATWSLLLFPHIPPLLPLLLPLPATWSLLLSPHIPPLLPLLPPLYATESPFPSPPCNGSITMTAGSRGVRRGTGKHELTSSLFFCSPPETRVALFDVTAYVTATSARWCCAGRGLAHTFLRPFFARGSHIALSLRGYS